MAFFASPEREFYENRLKRSSSTTSVRHRPHRPAGSERFPPRSYVASPSHPPPRPSTPDVVPSAPSTPSQAASVPRSSSPSPPRITALNVREHTIQDLKQSSSLQPSVPSPTTVQADDGSRASKKQCDMLHPKSGLQQPHPNTPSPSASSRSKMIFDTGSVSDSGITSRTTRLGISSASKGYFSSLDLRHPSPSSPNLSLSGFSDSCTPECSPSPLHPSLLDVKRLLSKPAAPGVVSTLSIASDSESPTFSRSPLNSSKAWPSKARPHAPPKVIIGSSAGSRSESSETEQSPATPPPPLQQRPENLHSERSTSDQTRAIMSATQTSSLSPLQSSTPPPAAVPSRSTPLQSLVRSRAAVPAPAPPYGTGRLTPAGVIAQAYREQNTRREALAAAARVEKALPIIPVSALWLDTFEHHHTSGQTIPLTPDREPFYIGLGTSDSFVMVDNTQGALHHAGDHSPYVPGSGVHSPSVNATQPIRSLTRKVSARFRRGLAAVSGAGVQLGRGQGDGEDVQANHLRSNANDGERLEGQLSLDLHKTKRKPESLRLSIDSPPPSSGQGESLDERLGHTTQGGSMLDSVKGKEKAQEKKDDASSGSRLWRLVKRISTGALRERFQATGTPPPPVPPMPKELLPPLPCTTVEVQTASENTSGGDGHTDAGDKDDGVKGVTSRCIDSNLSTSGVSHNDNHSSRSPQPSLQGHAQPRRPSISSSRQSSETPSIRFFRSRSSRSSFSSIIGSSPPPPPVSMRALPRSPSPRTDMHTKNHPSSLAHGTSHDEPRSSSSSHNQTRGRSSPDIPTFSVTGVMNNLILRRPSLTRHNRHHAPARSMIVPHSAGEAGSAPLRRAGSDVRRIVRQHRRVDPAVSKPGSSGQNRNSQGSDSTLRPLLTSGENAVGPLTFREVGSEQQEALTSQEKEDKWHALLEKSARAGGTLHLGMSALASDNMRFSSSTLSSDV